MENAELAMERDVIRHKVVPWFNDATKARWLWPTFVISQSETHGVPVFH